MDVISTDDLSSRLRLLRCNLPARTIQSLLETFGHAGAIFNASSQQLENKQLTTEQIQRIQNPDDRQIERDLSWLEKDRHGILFFDQPQYPSRLLEISEPPYALYFIGDTDYLHQPQLAMVGSRSASASGLQIAEDFAFHLSEAGITVTSGLAHGIDAASHKGALRGLAGSVAVVANGLHTIYPKSNTRLAAQIADNGCIISEAPIGSDPHKGMFPRRNRIISGLSIGTLVVEAALRSGSLITSKHAMEQGREVFAIPGSIHNPLAKGCHSLIKSGAKLVESAADILEELFPLVNSDSIRHTSARERSSSIVDTPTDMTDPDYQQLLHHMEYEPIGIDELVERSNLGAPEIASMLLILELQGQVVSQNGLYSRTSI